MRAVLLLAIFLVFVILVMGCSTNKIYMSNDGHAGPDNEIKPNTDIDIDVGVDAALINTSRQGDQK